MIYLVYGGSGSGKSSFAEKLLADFPGSKKYYIATMMAQKDDEDAQKKIARHKEMRAGKGFKTIEQPRDLEKISFSGAAGTTSAASALLECMSNLCANEMFDGGNVSRIIPALYNLADHCQHMVMVTNGIRKKTMK